MRWIVALALRLRVMVVALAVVGAVAAGRSLLDVPLDVFPEFAPPLIEVQTEAPGLSTEQVEALVTVQLENALNGTPWLKTIRSRSVLGLSSVVLILETGTDLMAARQLVQERLARAAPLLPAAAHPPVMLAPLSSTSRALKIGLSSDSLSQIDLTTLARWTIRPRLMSVPGVANVAIWGQRDRQLQVLVDPDRLRAHGVSVRDVLTATGRAVAVGPGGFIDTPNQRIAVNVRPTISGAADLARSPITQRRGAMLTLGDVATVAEGHQVPIGDAVINDGPGLLLIVEKYPWGNTLAVTRGVDAALEELAPALTGVLVDASIFRPATFIEMALGNLRRAMLFGCVLVIVVLAVFLADWRTALISVTAIPLALLAAAGVFQALGRSLDTMVIAGLVIALGEVVDDAIIDVENVMRRLRENTVRTAPLPVYRVVLEACVEVRSAVVYGTFIVLLVVLPVFFLPGLAGSFFRPLALAYLLAVGASLLVALTVTPALAMMLLPRSAAARPRESRFLGWLKSRYSARLEGLVSRPRRAISTALLATFAALAVFPLLGEELLPHFREYDFLMHFVEKPGTSLEAMSRITLRASRELRAIPGVRNFGAHIGRAEVADEVVGPNFTELWISLDPEVDYDATVAQVQEAVDGYPGLQRDLLTYLRERVKEVLTGASASIVVRIYGPELATLRSKAAEVQSALAGIAGIVDLKTEQQVLVPQIEVYVRTDVAAALGLTTADVQQMTATILQGAKAGEIYEGQNVFDVVVRGMPHLRNDLVALAGLPITTAAGAVVPLRNLADVRITPTPNQINREHASRRIDITANVRGRDLGSVARDVAARVAEVQFDRGYHPALLGEYAEREAARRRLLALAGLSLVGILLLLRTDFESWRLAALVFASLPFALVGGVAVAALAGWTLSLGSLVGFVTVIGIAARNGLMLVSHYRHLEDEEGMPFGRELVLRGARERLAPVLMTALATGLALVPLALGGARPGHEIEHPMAIVIVGGLASSTILNLFLMPTLYLAFGRREVKQG